MKITPTSLTINQLFGATNEQYVIPTYQRRYTWNEKQVYELIEDIGLIEEADTHLLGSIVCLAGHHQAGVNQLELVPQHSDYDWSISSQSRMGMSCGATRISMLRATPG